MYRPSQTPRLTLSSEQVAQARPVPPRRETGGPSLGARSVDNSMVRFPLHRTLTKDQTGDELSVGLLAVPQYLPRLTPGGCRRPDHVGPPLRSHLVLGSRRLVPNIRRLALRGHSIHHSLTNDDINFSNQTDWKVPTLVRARPHRFLRRRASPSLGAVPFLLLDPSPTGSALRANPFPKVTDPFCRLPLPTLVHRLEAVHLGDLLRMWVRSGTKITLPHSDFQGPTGAHRTAQEPHCSTEPPSLSRGEPIPGTRSPYREKKTLPGAPIGVSELVCVAALGPEGPISVAGFGTVNPIPFWLQRGVSDSQTELHKRARF
ncbi:hypothetical protein HPB49_000871 [Dermacentor silvarum]|uniref:Uncharacterized protein n=1 Tax=Dermacentor silvarum TaxID=543639 RepID=A0ACB8CU58_DERSI|nr:hypothetical protein HPB49_000871 [Dermacentor silvarum]